jgi:hypothetical protein
MPSMSRWMIGYGVLLCCWDMVILIVPQASSGTAMPMMVGWTAGPLIIAAGLAAAQGRRSLRLTGTYVGLLLPLAMTGLFGWHAADLWRSRAPEFPSVAYTGLALASILTVWIIVRVRPREGIASRGYAVTIASPPSRTTPGRQQLAADQAARRSEAG